MRDRGADPDEHAVAPSQAPRSPSRRCSSVLPNTEVQRSPITSMSARRGVHVARRPVRPVERLDEVAVPQQQRPPRLALRDLGDGDHGLAAAERDPGHRRSCSSSPRQPEPVAQRVGGCGVHLHPRAAGARAEDRRVHADEHPRAASARRSGARPPRRPSSRRSSSNTGTRTTSRSRLLRLLRRALLLDGLLRDALHVLVAAAILRLRHAITPVSGPDHHRASRRDVAPCTRTRVQARSASTASLRSGRRRRRARPCGSR